MSAYAFFEVRLAPDPTPEALAAYDRYRAAVPAMVEAHGGVYLARAWNGQALEGDPAADRFHLIEFPTAEAADAFWASPEYREIVGLRGDAVDVRAIVISPPA